MIVLPGHIHPLLVHLTIGILLMELFLQWLEGRPKYPAIKPAVHVVMLCGSVTAVASCITGYLLSLSENYGARLVNWQM